MTQMTQIPADDNQCPYKALVALYSLAQSAWNQPGVWVMHPFDKRWEAMLTERMRNEPLEYRIDPHATAPGSMIALAVRRRKDGQ